MRLKTPNSYKAFPPIAKTDTIWCQKSLTNSNDILSASLSDLSRLLQAGNLSSTELTRFFLQRIADHSPQLNAFITSTEDRALQQAAHCDKLLAAGKGGRLTGIPYAHKDLFCTQGVLTTCGSKMLGNFKAPFDATVSERLNEAGMVMLGKTNMDEFAMGSSNENSFYGPVRNPWNLDCVSGGSSGGSAVAVAAGLAPCATGTDTGGSIRQPSAFCGVSGIKPTYGRVSRYGMIAYASSLDQGGVFARNALDCALVLHAIAGFDPRDSTSVESAVPDYAAHIEDGIQGLRIGLPKQYFNDDLSAPLHAALDATRKIFEESGCEIVEVDLASTELAISTYYIIASAECSSNLSRYDGVRYGHRCQDPSDLKDLHTRSRAEGFGKEVKRRITMGTYVLSSGYYDAYYLRAQKARRLIRDDFVQAFDKVDALLAPVTPTPAFKIGEKLNPIAMYLSDIYTVAVNLAGLPAMSIPAGFVDGLPAGVQLIAPHFEEQRLLQLAHHYQSLSDYHRSIPEAYQ